MLLAKSETYLKTSLILTILIYLSAHTSNHFFYRFNSGNANHFVLHGFSGDVLSVALFRGDCEELECVYSSIDFCGESNDLAITVEPWTDYWIGIFGSCACDFVIDYDLSCHGNCGCQNGCN